MSIFGQAIFASGCHMTYSYLSDVLIGCQDDFIESRRRDLQALLESNGHHSALRGTEKQSGSHRGDRERSQSALRAQHFKVKEQSRS